MLHLTLLLSTIASLHKILFTNWSLDISKLNIATGAFPLNACSEAMVDSNKVRTGKLDEDDWVKLAGAIGPLSEAEMYIDDHRYFSNGNKNQM